MFTNLMNREANESHYISLFAAGFIDPQAVCSIAQSLEGQKGFHLFTINDPYAGSPTKTLLRLFLPTDEEI